MVNNSILELKIISDSKDLINPEMARISDQLRQRWTSGGVALPELADRINSKFNYMAGLNKDNLYRCFYGGYKKGVCRWDQFLPKVWFIAGYWSIDKDSIMLDAGEEHLRRWLLAECLKKDIEPSDIVRCIQNINYGDAIAVKDWLQGSSSSGIISLLPLLSSCLEEIGIDISPREMRGQIEFLQG
jgi:hypothetical protein